MMMQQLNVVFPVDSIFSFLSKDWNDLISCVTCESKLLLFAALSPLCSNPVIPTGPLSLSVTGSVLLSAVVYLTSPGTVFNAQWPL